MTGEGRGSTVFEEKIQSAGMIAGCGKQSPSYGLYWGEGRGEEGKEKNGRMSIDSAKRKTYERT